MGIAKEYLDNDKEFYSKTGRGVYKIKYVSKDKVVIKKLKGKNDEVIGKRLFLNNFKNSFGFSICSNTPIATRQLAVFSFDMMFFNSENL